VLAHQPLHRGLDLLLEGLGSRRHADRVACDDPGLNQGPERLRRVRTLEARFPCGVILR